MLEPWALLLSIRMADLLHEKGPMPVAKVAEKLCVSEEDVETVFRHLHELDLAYPPQEASGSWDIFFPEPRICRAA